MNKTVALIEIIQNSEESYIQSLHVDGQLLTIHLFHDALDQVIEFKIKTPLYYSSYVSGEFSPCYLKLNLISDDLSVERGVYVASVAFESFMDECRNGFQVAYGLRASQFMYFLKFLGSCEIIIPLRNVAEITFKFISNNAL